MKVLNIGLVKMELKKLDNREVLEFIAYTKDKVEVLVRIEGI